MGHEITFSFLLYLISDDCRNQTIIILAIHAYSSCVFPVLDNPPDASHREDFLVLTYIRHSDYLSHSVAFTRHLEYLQNQGCLFWIEHVSNSGVMEELRLNCYSEKVTNYLLKEAKLLRSSLDQEVNNIPERFLVVFADAMDWNNKEKLHKYPDENERLEGIYDTYDDAYKVLEKASRSGIHNLTVEIRREVQFEGEDKWYGLMEPPLDVMTTDIHGNISEIETLHFPEQKEIEAVKEKRWRFNESFPPRRRRGR